MVWKVTSLSVTSALFSVIVVVVYLLDGRSMRRGAQRKFSIRHNTFKSMDEDERYDLGWFRRELCCSKAMFNVIVSRVESRWIEVNEPLDPFRAIFSIRERVALTLYHLAHKGTYAASGYVFGISKTRALAYVYR